MKNKIKLFAAVAMGAMSLMTSCSSEAVDSATDAVMLEAEVTGIANTRAAVEGTTLPAGSNYGLCVMKSGSGVANNIKMSANSTATGYMIVGNSEILVGAYYPYSEKAVAIEDVVDIYPGSTDYLHTISYGVCTKSNPKASIQLHHALARVKFNVTVASGVSTSYKVLLNAVENVYTKGYMRLGIVSNNVYGNTNDVAKLDNAINGDIKAGETLSTEVFLLPQTITSMVPSVSLYINGESNSLSKEIVSATASGKWESGKVYTYNITISEEAKVSVSAATIEEWGEVEEIKGVTAKEEKMEHNGHEYVDLGLPSGTLWATCNVGASSPEGYGYYYAWGETSPKATYIESNYTYLDNPTRLPLESDAAYVNWGGKWRMPNVTELHELIDNCTWTITSVNGISGYEVVSKFNDASLFLPYAGFYNVSGLSFVGKQGRYCTSSITSSAFYALSIINSGVSVCNSTRQGGYSVRPVLSK